MCELDWTKDENIELRRINTENKLKIFELEKKISDMKYQIEFEKSISKIQGKIKELEYLLENYDEKSTIITIKGRLQGHQESLAEMKKYAK